MKTFLARRLLMAFLTVLAVAVVTFFLMKAIPGNPWLGEKTPSPETIRALNAKYGLDQPPLVQLVKYLGNVLRGDFGVSVKMMKNYPVRDIILEMFPVSAKLGVIALLWAIPAGIALGCLAAWRRGRPADGAVRVVSSLGVAVPEFVMAVLLLALFAAGGVFPVFPSSFQAGKIGSYILPCLTLGLYPMCYIARQTRASALEALSREHVTAAWARGLSGRTVLLRHVLRNALIPVIACLGPLTAFVLTGSLVVEKVFSIPGLGRYFTQSVLNRDYPVIMGTAIFLAALLSAVNLAADLICRAADPRIDFAEGVQ